jgi:class 3 adenylate cyclase
VNCPGCGHENPEVARFCGACGRPLEPLVACPSCGAPAEPGQHFCTACGHSLDEPAPAAAEAAPGAPDATGERKQVTVLFADVKGSMDLAGALDPEDWREVMNRFLRILASGIERFEGTVDKFTGDGVMALFGAPVAHEDHAARACYAALSLREDLADYATELRRDRGLSFSVRIGINSGEVVVGAMGDDGSLAYTAVGHTVGLAQRMEALAEPGTTYLTGATAALVEGYFTLRDLGEFTVKGVTVPIHVHQLVGVGALRTRMEVAAARGLSRFVGRSEELGDLGHAWERAAAGDGQVVSVVAEPGLGKSRLCLEFVTRRREEGVEVNEAHALAHARSVPFLPVFEIMRGYFGIGETDDDQVARQKVAGRMLLLDPGLTEALPLVFEFLGIPDPERPAPQLSSEERQRRLFAALNQMQRVQRAQKPGVVVVEDLHWLDPGSELFLANLVESVPGTGVLVITTSRPGYAADWMSRSFVRRLPLPPLPPEATDELVAGLLGGDPSLDGLAEQIRERAGGNPFFVEEVVQALAEDGALIGTRGAYRLGSEIGEIRIPPTVQPVLAARIDRLPEREKAVLQAASVLGREFTAPVLERVAGLGREELDQALRRLVADEFVFQQALYPVAEYVFKHALTEEVTYGSQLAEQRRRGHAAAAPAIEELEADRLDEQAALIAHHWGAAGEALPAARWSARAASWAGYTDQDAAIRHWQRVRDLTSDAVEDEALGLGILARAQLLNLAWRYGRPTGLYDQLEDLRTEGEALADRSGLSDLRALLRTGYAGAILVTGRINEAYVLCEHLLETVSREIRLAVVTGVAFTMALRGESHGTIALLERELELAGGDRTLGAGLGWPSPYCWAEMFLGAMQAFVGRLAEGRATVESALRHAREDGDVENQVYSRLQLVAIADFAGGGPDALANAQAGLELAERAGAVYAQVWARYYFGVALGWNGDWAAGAESIRSGVDLARERGVGIDTLGWLLPRLVDAQLAMGQAEAALATARDGFRHVEEIGTLIQEPEVRRALARALLAAEGAAAAPLARAELERGLAAARERDMAAFEPRLRDAMAEVAEALGDHQGAERERAEAVRLRSVMTGAGAGASG